jgi:hypothetical protein
MRFKDQVWWCSRSGAVLLLIAGVLIGFVMIVVDENNPDPAFLPVGILGGVALSGAWILLAFGVVMRSAHRWLYLQSRESLLLWPRVTIRQRFTQGWDAVFWKWWLHIDEVGNDPDA